jgi:IS30 family transposase
VAKSYHPNRKASDEDIIRLNSVGLSLATIAEKLGCHTSTITQRLRSLNINPADTRRAFMEDIYTNMPSEQQAWLESQLGAHIPIKNYIKNLLVKEFLGSAPTGETHAV